MKFNYPSDHQVSYINRSNAVKNFLESKINEEYADGLDVVLFEIKEPWLSEQVKSSDENYIIRVDELLEFIKRMKFKYTFWKFGREDDDISNTDLTHVKGVFVYVGYSGG